MSNISVPYTSDQTPNYYQQPLFIDGEAPTSPKLNLFGAYINTQFGILSEAIGNSFVYGQPSVAGSIGTLANITQGGYNSNSLVALATPQYNGSNLYNELAASINPVITPNGYQITLTSGVIGPQNIMQVGSTYFLINVNIVTKNGSGYIDEVFPATFTIPGYAGSGSINTFFALFGDVPPTGSIYVETVNVSLTQLVQQLSVNQGNLQYGRIQGYTASNDNVTNLGYTVTTPGPTQTAEINAIENKTFLVQWHGVVNKQTATTSDATNYYWYTTSSSSALQGGSFPTASQAQSFIATNNISLPSNITQLSYAGVSGIPISTPGGSTRFVSVTYSASNLVIAIPIADLVNIPNTQNIDIYFPVTIPFRMLQSMNLNYGDYGTQLPDFLLSVIGYQYGWNQAPQPATIASRLTQDESNIATLQTQMTQVLGNTGFKNNPVIYGPGTYTITTGPTQVSVLIEATSGGGGGGWGWGASYAGTGGGSGAYNKWYSQVTPNTNYTLIVGAGGTAGTNAGASPGNPGQAGGSTSFNGFTLLPGGGGNTGFSGSTGTVFGGTGGTAITKVQGNGVVYSTNGAKAVDDVHTSNGPWPGATFPGFPADSLISNGPNGGLGNNPGSQLPVAGTGGIAVVWF